MTTDRLSALDLFSGAGGLSCGLEMTGGIRVIGGIEHDARAHATFRANHPHARVPEGPSDIHDVRGAELLERAGIPRLDLLAGGPPCQGFSNAGYRDPADLRNSLVFQYIRLVAELRPRFLVMENVTGMVSFRVDAREFVLDRVCRELGALGYALNVSEGRPDTWKAAIVNAADYGVPQQRRRVLVLGSLEGDPPVLQPTHAPADRSEMLGLRPWVTVREALEDLPEPIADEPQDYGPALPGNDFARLMREGAERLPDHVPTRHRPGMPERMAAQGPGEPLYESWGHAWVRLDPAKPAPTVKENHNAPFVHPWQPRVTSPRECARLQSFPDRFSFEGPKSRKLVQVGNAVPPLLGLAVGRAVIRAARAAAACAAVAR